MLRSQVPRFPARAFPAAKQGLQNSTFALLGSHDLQKIKSPHEAHVVYLPMTRPFVISQFVHCPSRQHSK